MVQYKLVYFDARGLGEAARLLFHAAGVSFEDYRIGIEEFQKLKPTLPAGHVPILYVDGFEISESATINRYLARKFGLAGKTPEEEASADTVVDFFKDYLVSYRQMSSAVFFGKSADEIEKIKNEVTGPATELYFSKLNKILTKSSSGFLVGNSLTWADIVVFDNLVSLKNFELFDAQKEKNLGRLFEKVKETPKLKDYIEKRAYSIV